MEMIWHSFERILAYWKGRLSPAIRSSGTATLIGEAREGGYYYLTSPDLPGFTFMLEPSEADDVQKTIEAITPALQTYIIACMKAHAAKIAKEEPRPRISYADLRGLHKRKPINLVAEFC
jgi:hypothetical protein